MATEHLARPLGRPLARVGLRPVTRAFLGGILLGLVLGLALGGLVAAMMSGGGLKLQSKWTDTAGGWVRLPEQTAVGSTLPQTVSLPAATYDFGGVGEPLNPSVTDTPSIVKVEVQAQSGQVGVSLARPDGGELVSREVTITPQQGKTTLYFRTAPGMGPVDVLLRSADNTPAGASATVTKVQVARQADIGQGEMDRIAKAGFN